MENAMKKEVGLDVSLPNIFQITKACHVGLHLGAWLLVSILKRLCRKEPKLTSYYLTFSKWQRHVM